MKYLKMMIIAILCVMIFSACGKAKDSSEGSVTSTNSEAVSGKNSDSSIKAVYQKITPEQAKEKMDSGAEVTVVDVRTKGEYDTGYIPSAILIPNETINTEMPDELPDLDAEILVYCRSGNRSAQAAKKLVAMGYTNVYDFGGISEWTYETTSE